MGVCRGVERIQLAIGSEETKGLTYEQPKEEKSNEVRIEERTESMEDLEKIRKELDRTLFPGTRRSVPQTVTGTASGYINVRQSGSGE
jgi:hypothetical protein